MDYNAEYDKWLSSPVVDESTKSAMRDPALDKKELFSVSLEFGTAGLRGIMRPGTNSMNVYTVRHATQGISNLVLSQNARDKGIVIAYDSRNHSKEFAEAAAEVIAANGIKAYIFDDIRPTPELSFALIHLGCKAGINITASHNPKEYNGYKAYWEDGAQLPPDHAETVSQTIASVDIFGGVKTIPYAEGIKSGLIEVIGSGIDEKYLAEVAKQSVNPDAVRNAGADFKVVYTPLHGAGRKLVPEILKRQGLSNLLTVPEQMIPDGNFPTVKFPNPEFREVFNPGIEIAKRENCSLLIGTDPDADRTGIVVRDSGGEYIPFSGNQVGALLLDYIITAKKERGELPANAFAVKTIVSTELASKICADNGVELFDVLTGFKFIGEKIKEYHETGKLTFLFGFEESYGYLAGTYARDKDAVVASMLLVEMAAFYKSRNMTLYDAMESIYKRYGYYGEAGENIGFKGLSGVARMKEIMSELRRTAAKTVREIAGYKVTQFRDYQTSEITDTVTGKVSGTGLPKSDVLYFSLDNGSKVIIRPSGTEPKIKIYYLLKDASKESAAEQTERLKAAMLSVVARE
ncbi:phosphomannomutase [Clostridia bacterium]|nr:phosphomannomutase [Clostridia bacterium]